MNYNTKNKPFLKLRRNYWVSCSILIIIIGACGSPDDNSVEEDDLSVVETESALNNPIIEATSLSGEGLVRPDFDHETTERLTNNLRQAIENYNNNPEDPESIIWVARHTAYLWRYQDAIYVLTDGLTDYPEDPRFYRHRGHRYISIREFDKAIQDLEKASALIQGTVDEVEPDGAPNSANIPVSTLHFNVYYHLGLAYYLKYDYSKAATEFQKAFDVSRNVDTQVSALDWLYISLRKSGRDTDAARVLNAFNTNVEVIESQSYLSRLKVYKGELQPESLLEADNDLNILTQGYGLAQYYLLLGEREKATELLEKVLETNYWAAFGYIAAEAELHSSTLQNQ